MGLEPQVHKLLATLYAAPMRPELWAEALQGIAAHVGLEKGALLTHDFASDSHGALAFAGDGIAEAARLYAAHYWRDDVWMRIGTHFGPVGQVCLGTKYWPDDALCKSEFYNDYLKKCGIRHMATVVTSREMPIMENLTLYRDIHEAAFDLSDFQRLNEIIPHLQSALVIRRKLSALETRVVDLENALDRLESGLVLLDNRGCCVFVNQAAKTILDQHDGIFLKRSVLCANGTAASQLRALIAAAIATSVGKNSYCSGGMLIQRVDRKPLQILVAPFRPDAVPGSAKATAIAILTDPERKSALPAEILRMLFGLTTAESRLALAMTDGKSISEAADLYQIGLETVRTQVKSIFQKTGARRQAELVKLLTGIAIPSRRNGTSQSP